MDSNPWDQRVRSPGKATPTLELTIVIEDPDTRASLFGTADENLRLLRSSLGVHITARESLIKVSGEAAAVGKAAVVLESLQRRLRNGDGADTRSVEQAIADVTRPDRPEGGMELAVYSAAPVAPRTQGQRSYLETIQKNDLTFCIGPAGTGKTYLAVAVAVSMLKANRIKRVVLVRPAVEAGEKLGYLPGDIQAKVNPYLRPLFDAMGDMMGFEQVKRFMENDVIEVIPLAFMRGRTLNNALIILDEGQNTTVSQMLMFLTRLGTESKMIITGDDSQVDLPRGQASGIVDAAQRLSGIAGVGMVYLQRCDIVRHPLVNAVVQAYADRDEPQARDRSTRRKKG
ncbi:MAG: PhoH family protein [Planctomycetes bacterium]|nr:PhoH family protein [Planctomycetota bacterium]